jgi:hypothetical protein
MRPADDLMLTADQGYAEQHWEVRWIGKLGPAEEEMEMLLDV